jgi:predicted transcriptional regulator of viral defense system
VFDGPVFILAYRDRVQPGELADLSEPLARATALVKACDSTATAVPVEERPGFLLAGADVSEPLLRLRGRSNGYVLLAASGPTKGPTNARWRVRVNVDEEALLAHRLTG